MLLAALAVVAGVAVPRVRVAALEHEAGHDAVEGDAVVVPLLGERREVGGGQRRHVGEQLEADLAQARDLDHGDVARGRRLRDGHGGAGLGRRPGLACGVAAGQESERQGQPRGPTRQR